LHQEKKKLEDQQWEGNHKREEFLGDKEKKYRNLSPELLVLKKKREK